MKPFIPFFLGMRTILHRGRTRSIPQQLRGSILGIALSIIPLLVVIVVTNGMIEGITNRFIEITTYHLQVSFFSDIRPAKIERLKGTLAALPAVRYAFVERSGFVQIRSAAGLAGSTVRCVPPELYDSDPGFRRYFRILDGSFNLTPVPLAVEADLFRDKLLPRVSADGQGILEAGYMLDSDTKRYLLRDSLTQGKREAIGNCFSEAGYTPVLLGKSLAEKLKVRIGDPVYLLSMVEFHKRMVPKAGRFILTGVFSTGYQDIDKLLAYIPYAAGVRLLPAQQAKEFIGLKLQDPFKALKASVDSVESVLAKDDNVFAHVETWYDLQINQYRSFQTTRSILIFIMILIVLVASVNVSSAIVMIVMDRTQEIAILKSMGASPGMISLSFIFTGMCTGILGALLGIVLGLFVAVNINEVFRSIEFVINALLSFGHFLLAPVVNSGPLQPVMILNPDYYLEQIPVTLTFAEVALVGFLTVFLSTLAAWIPAREAGRIRPLEIIRKY